MKPPYLLITLGILLFVVYQSQSQTDSTITARLNQNYHSTFYAPRVGISYQKIGCMEIGVSRFFASSNLEAGGHISYQLTGEVLFNNNEVIFGIKAGGEIMAVGMMAIIFGADITDYIYKDVHYACFTPNLVLPLTRNATPLLLFKYGYNINDFQSLGDKVGNHRLSIIFNICLKQHKAINAFHKSLRK